MPSYAMRIARCRNSGLPVTPNSCLAYASSGTICVLGVQTTSWLVCRWLAPTKAGIPEGDSDCRHRSAIPDV